MRIFKGSWQRLRTDKILSMLGLAKKAGRIAGGEFAVSKAVRGGNARVVVVAADASDNTRKMFINMCTFYNVPCYLYSSKAELGHALGRDIQASVSVLDDGFADAIIKKFEEAGVQCSFSQENINVKEDYKDADYFEDFDSNADRF